MRPLVRRIVACVAAAGAFGLGVVAPGRARPTLVQSTIRAVLLCLLVPAVVMDGNGRGLHDMAAGTILRRTQESGQA